MSIAYSSKMALSRKGSGQKETVWEVVGFYAKILFILVVCPCATIQLIVFIFGTDFETRGGWICQSRNGLVASRIARGKVVNRKLYLDGDRVSLQEYSQCTWTQVPHN